MKRGSIAEAVNGVVARAVLEKRVAADIDDRIIARAAADCGVVVVVVGNNVVAFAAVNRDACGVVINGILAAVAVD